MDVSGGDPADGHEWKFRGNVPDRAQLLESHYRIVIRFSAGCENGSECDVVDWQTHCRFHLLLSVCGEANQRIVSNQTTRGFGWHVVLSKVDAPSANCHCDVNAIVDNQCDAIVAGNFGRGFGVAKEIDRRQMLFAQLDEGGATIDEPLHLFSMTQTGKLSIGDGIDLR